MHDALDGFGPNENTTVAVFFDSPPTDAQVEALVSDLEPSWYLPLYSLPAVLLNTSAEAARSATSHSGVTAVDSLTHPLFPSLDISAPAVRVTASATYSPNTVREAFGATGEGVLVAFIDSGISKAHETFRSDRFVTGGLFLTPAPPATCLDPGYTSPHGTHVAGIAVGAGAPQTLTNEGMAPDAKFMDLRIFPPQVEPFGLPPASPENAIAAYDWAIKWNDQIAGCLGIPFKAIDIMNLSVGTVDDCGQGTQSEIVEEGFNHGIIAVHAAGNAGDGVSTLFGPTAEAGTIHVAAAYDALTAERSNDLLWDGSSRGPRCYDGNPPYLAEMLPHVAAPGVIITSSWPSTEGGQPCGDCYRARTGTSMAAPHVSGIIALMLEKAPCLRPTSTSDTRVRDILLNTSDYRTEVIGPNPPQHSGTGHYGLPWNNSWGYGYVDAYKAVQAADQITC